MGAIQLSKALGITGWMSPTELFWLGETAKHSRSIIEVGSFKGRSSIALAENTEGILYCVDPWPDIYYQNNGEPLLAIGNPIYEEFLANISGLSNIITFRGTLQEFEQQKIANDIDFIFIDGDHREEAVIADITSAMRLTKKGSIIAGHDYTHSDWPAVKKVVDKMFPQHHGVDSIWWIQRY